MKLPYGLPHNLRMPLDPDSVEDSAIQEFIDSASDEFLILDGEYHTKMEEISKRIRENHIEITEKSGWTIAESALLFYIITALEESATITATTNLQADLIARIFPNKKREQVIHQKYLLKTKKFLEEKRANIIRDWLRDKAELEAKTNSAWDALHKEKAKRLEKTIKLKKQREICLQWASLLTKMRRAKSERIKMIQTMAEPISKQLSELERAKQHRETERKFCAKSAAEKYKEKKTEEALNARRKKDEMNKIMEQAKKIQLKNHRHRVQLRQSEFELKMETRKAKEEAAQKERQRKAAMLEDLKEKPEINYDPSNVLADTHVSSYTLNKACHN